MEKRQGVLICGHGSRDDSAIQEFVNLVAAVRSHLPDQIVDHAFLEFANPTIVDGLERIRLRGIDQILAIPAMLLPAGHVNTDLPLIFEKYQKQHSNTSIRFGRELGVGEKIRLATSDQIRRAIAKCAETVSGDETLLLVVGRGASDPDANGEIIKLMRWLWEDGGFGWGEVCFSGVAFPLVETALEHAARLGYRRIVVLPFFLFTGVLVQRLRQNVEDAAKRHPKSEFVTADYLADHPMVIDTFLERIGELMD